MVGVDTFQEKSQNMEALGRSNLRHDGLLQLMKSDVADSGPVDSALQHLHAASRPAATRQLQSGGRFAAALCQESRRVGQIYRSRHEQLWSQLLDTTALIKMAAAGEVPNANAPEASQAALRQALDSIAENVVELDAFVDSNASKAADIAQVVDASSRSSDSSSASDNSSKQYLDAATRAITGPVHLDSLILGLSDAYDALRCVEQGRTLGEKAAKWVAPQHFARVTRKFWLRPSDVTLFKTAVVKHLPVLVYGKRPKLGEVDAEQLPFMAPVAERDSGEISSVYLDAFPELPSYHSRLRRDDNATAVRVRWYGERNLANPHQEMFVERKVHKGKWTGEKSVKDRAAVQQHEVPSFLAGQTLRQGQEDRDALFLKEVQSHVVKTKMEPALRTVYQRTAFQEESNNLVRISMDTGLTTLRDGREKSGAWCRGDVTGCPSDVFPYAVVEVKLQAPPGQWLKDLVSSGILIPSPKFSKFQHGMAMLCPGAALQAPYWFLPDETDAERLTLATWEEMAAGAAADVADPAAWLYPEEENVGAADAGDAEQPMQRSSRPTAKLHLVHGGSQSSEVRQGPLQMALSSSVWPLYQDPPPPPPSAVPDITEAYRRDSGQVNYSGSDSLAVSTRGPTSSDPSLHDVEAGQGVWGQQNAGGAPELVAAAAAPAADQKLLMQHVFKGNGAGDDGLKSSGLEQAPPRSASIKARQIMRTRVEPKTHFANERTFLQWLNISILVMILAMSMLSGSGVSGTGTVTSGSATGVCGPGDKSCFASRLSGAIIAPVALVFMAYALFQYKKRSYQIMMQATVRYDDQRGPVVLVVILFGALITSYAVSMIYVF